MPVAPKSFQDLSFSSELVVWAARMWVQANAQTLASESQLNGMIRDSFRLAGATDAYPPFVGLLTVVDATSTTPVAFQRPKCRKLSVDELRLLCVLAVLQSDTDDEAAQFLLSAWLPRAGARMAVEQGRALADALSRAGHAIASPLHSDAEERPAAGRAEAPPELTGSA